MPNQNFNKNSEQHWMLLVLILREIAIDKGITHLEIAEKTGLKRSNVTRIFSIKYCPSLDIFLKIARAIGSNFFIEDNDSKSELNVLFEKAMLELGRRVDRNRLN